MPKNIVVESIKHHLLRAFERSSEKNHDGTNPAWQEFIDTLEISPENAGEVKILWSRPTPGHLSLEKGEFALYRRGDIPTPGQGLDPVVMNQQTADRIVGEIRKTLGFNENANQDELLMREQSFHDKWAMGTSVDDVMVKESFEACTAPENRYIIEVLGDVRGKKILDLGCGLGEAAVYFAIKGGDVTASDLSTGMLEVASKVATKYGVQIKTHACPADVTGLPDASFDIVYAANILHHSDIPKVLTEARRILRPGGVFVSWDPLIHNPAINVYRKLAQAVRTIDEHPLHMKELRYFKENFSEVKWRCFWLSTLLVFVRFYFWERVNPSKERYWKKILVEADRLAPFYTPLEKFDRLLLRVFPFLGRYCWNIVVWCRR